MIKFGLFYNFKKLCGEYCLAEILSANSGAGGQLG